MFCIYTYTQFRIKHDCVCRKIPNHIQFMTTQETLLCFTGIRALNLETTCRQRKSWSWTLALPCRIWGIPTGGLLGHNAVQSEGQMTIACYLFHAAFLSGLFPPPWRQRRHVPLETLVDLQQTTQHSVPENRVLLPMSMLSDSQKRCAHESAEQYVSEWSQSSLRRDDGRTAGQVITNYLRNSKLQCHFTRPFDEPHPKSAESSRYFHVSFTFYSTIIILQSAPRSQNGCFLPDF
jgi:hypothetical protein